MKFEEKTLNSQVVYKGKVLTVLKDDVEVTDGHKSFREVILHSGGVVILAIKQDSILMVEQYRYPIKQTVLELPAGKLEPDEDPYNAAIRELEEETGYRTNNLISLGFINTTPGICNEKLYLYLAQNLEYVGEHPDIGEIINCKEYKISEVAEMIKSGKINDAKTICAIYRAGLVNDKISCY